MSGRAPAARTWWEVDDDGTVHLFLPKAELGQGSHTVLAQLLLDELGAVPDRLVVHHPDTGRGFPVGWMTVVGGTTADAMADPARRAGAALSTRLGRTAGEDRLVGTSMPRVDLPAKTTGAAVFTSDLRLPGMLYGAVQHPPRHGAVLHEVRGLEAARAVEGVAVVLVDPRTGLVAAAARRTRQAEAALAALVVDWRGGAALDEADLRAAVTVRPGEGHLVQDDGDAGAVLVGGDVRTVSAEYRTPLVASAPAEPPVAVVDATGDRVVVYASTQNPGLVQRQVARALRRRRSRVRVHVPYVGGSFGRKHGRLGDPAAAAARLSAAAGRPVHLAWTGIQDLNYGPKRPPSHHVLHAALDDAGTVLALRHQVAMGDGSAGWPLSERLARLTDIDFVSVFGAHLLYPGIPNLQAAYRRVPLPVHLGPMRSIGTFANVFAVESFLDEIACAAGADPLQLRLRHLGDDALGRRLRDVLSTATDAAGWGSPPPPGRARGLACTAYGRTVIACVVQVRKAEGEDSVGGLGLAVEHVTAAVDGRQVNPGIARAQVEGGVLMGISWALGERLTLSGGAVVDPERYAVLRARYAPRVTTVLLDGEHWGGGRNEIGAAPTGAALANAVYALTGRRVRELPLAPAGSPLPTP